MIHKKQAHTGTEGGHQQMSNNTYRYHRNVTDSMHISLFAISHIQPVNWRVSAIGMSRVCLWLLMVLMAAVYTVPMRGLGATSSPDAFEGPPYNDDASTTTLNFLSPQIAQDHTIHAEVDVDWGICIQTEPETEGTFPYSLSFTNLDVPSGSFLVVALYEDGPSSPPSRTVYIPSGQPSGYVSWIGLGIEQIYYSASAFGSVSPSMSYTVTFTEPTGANNGLAWGESPFEMRVEWETLGVDPSAQGFNVLQSTTGGESSFSSINPETIPIPTTPGDWVEYIASDLTPMTVYFYQIELIESDSSHTKWTDTFYGYTLPLLPSSVQEWELYN